MKASADSAANVASKRWASTACTPYWASSRTFAGGKVRRNGPVSGTEKLRGACRDRSVASGRPRAGQLGADHGRDEAAAQHAVGDALAEARRVSKTVVQVERVGVAGDAGEGCDVGLGHRLAEHRRHADREVLEIKAVHGRKRIRHFRCSPPAKNPRPKVRRRRRPLTTRRSLSPSPCECPFTSRQKRKP